MPLLALVDFDDLLGVDGQALVRVYHHTEQARISLNKRKNQLKNTNNKIKIK